MPPAGGLLLSSSTTSSTLVLFFSFTGEIPLCWFFHLLFPWGLQAPPSSFYFPELLVVATGAKHPRAGFVLAFSLASRWQAFSHFTVILSYLFLAFLSFSWTPACPRGKESCGPQVAVLPNPTLRVGPRLSPLVSVGWRAPVLPRGFPVYSFALHRACLGAGAPHASL